MTDPAARIYRKPIPASFSHPVGYQELDEVLGTLSRWPEVKLWFNDRPVFRASAFLRMLRSGEPLPIAELRHRHEGGWDLKLYPVPQEKAAAARQCLLEEKTMASLRRFLETTTASPCLRDYIRIGFDPATGAGSIKRPKL